ncbi:MAG TPA: hypothetical protein VGX28_12940 [Frankiaceae bacterium]|nr:hypothetical protein [Frankiaceae bacterium]
MSTTSERPDTAHSLVAAYRRSEAVVRAADAALRKHRTPEIEEAALRASEELLRSRVRLVDELTHLGWELPEDLLTGLDRDVLLLELREGAAGG